MLLDALPDKGKGLVHLGHKVVHVEQSTPDSSVTVTVLKTAGSDDQEEFKVEGDLLVAADGSMSQTRAQFHPDESRR